MRLIDADAIDFNYGGLSHIYPTDFIGIAKYFADQVKAMPTIDASPVVYGRWIGEEINIETGDISATLRECSVCHRIRPVDGYCSHCGAKMGLPEDGE